MIRVCTSFTLASTEECRVVCKSFAPQNRSEGGLLSALALGGSVVKVLSQIDVWCLPLQLPHPRNSLLLATSGILVHSELLFWWKLQYARGAQGGGSLGSL